MPDVLGVNRGLNFNYLAWLNCLRTLLNFDDIIYISVKRRAKQTHKHAHIDGIIWSSLAECLGTYMVNHIHCPPT